MKAIPRFLACVNTEATTLYLLVKNNYSKNICHYITVIVISESCSVISNYLWLHGLYSPWNSPDQYSGVGSLSHLQGIFPTQGSNAGLLHCRQILYQLSHKGSPRILEWIAYPFSSRPYWARNRTEVSCIAGRFITNWAIRGARMLQWVAMPSSRGSSQPRDWTQVSCIAGRFFNVWATREAQECCTG